MRHNSSQGGGVLSPNQLHMYSICLIQPLSSGIKQLLNLGSGSQCSQRAAWGHQAQEQPSLVFLALALSPNPLEAMTSSMALGMGEQPALARV